MVRPVHPLYNATLGKRFQAENARLAEAVAAFAPVPLGGWRFAPVLVHILDAPPDTVVGPHIHDCCELSFVLAGEVLYAAPNRRAVPVAAGAAFLMPPEVRHSWRTQRRSGVIFGFQLERTPAAESPAPGTWLELGAEQQGYSPMPTATARQLLALVRSHLAAASNQPEVLASLLAALLASALGPLLATATSSPSEPPAALRDRQDRLFRQARVFIAANLAVPIRATDVAQYAEVSLRHLNRIFIQRTGKTVWEWVQAERLERARRLLAQGEYLVKEVAALCGYPDAAYFSRVYRRACGHPPRATGHAR